MPTKRQPAPGETRDLGGDVTVTVATTPITPEAARRIADGLVRFAAAVQAEQRANAARTTDKAA